MHKPQTDDSPFWGRERTLLIGGCKTPVQVFDSKEICCSASYQVHVGTCTCTCTTGVVGSRVPALFTDVSSPFVSNKQGVHSASPLWAWLVLSAVRPAGLGEGPALQPAAGQPPAAVAPAAQTDLVLSPSLSAHPTMWCVVELSSHILVHGVVFLAACNYMYIFPTVLKIIQLTACNYIFSLLS